MLSTSFMSLNVFLWMLSCLLQLKIIWILSSISFFSQFFQILFSSWRLYHLVVFNAKLWDDNVALLWRFYCWSCANLDIFPFQRVLLFVKKSCSFHLDKCKGEFGCYSPLLFFGKKEYIRDEVRHTVRVQEMSHFCHPSWFFIS